MSSLNSIEVTEKLIKETAILMLSLKERDPTFGNKAAWDYIATELIGENNCKDILHYLIGETRPHVKLGTGCIPIGSNGVKELLLLLCINNLWGQMVLLNQLILHNILNRKEDLSTIKLRAAVAFLTSEQRDNTIFFLECCTEELAGLPDS